MTIAQYIANQLYNNGIRYIYGIPGGPSIPYMEAFSSAGIEFILTSGESSAAIMASVSSRLTGIPGVCHATFGPGATNLTTGTGCALLDRCPVLVLTSEMDDMMKDRTTQMNIDHQKLFDPLVKATFRMTPENAEEVICNALELCRQEYPGPVHIGLPSDLAHKEIKIKGLTATASNERIIKNNISAAASLLRKTRKPLLAVGLTSLRFEITEQLLEFLDSHRMPVLLTPMAKGILPESHPCYAGVLFHALSNKLEGIISGTDLVIGLGYDPVEFNYESWMSDVPLLHFDTRETDMPLSIKNIQFVGYPGEWFKILNTMEPGLQFQGLSELTDLHEEIASAFTRFTDHFGPVSAIKVLQEELPPDVILTVDVGSHLHLAGQYWKTHGKRNLIISNGWSGMGFGVPAALSASIINRDATVVCITGDGGFLMTAGEIITARRYNLPVIIVVFSDCELNLIKLKKSWQNLTPAGTLLYSGDLFGADTFLGIKVIDADTEQSMRRAVKKSLLLKEPVIINARIDPDDYKWLIVRR